MTRHKHRSSARNKGKVEIEGSDEDQGFRRNRSGGKRERKTPAATSSAVNRLAKVHVEAKTENQRLLLDHLNTKIITLASGCAGTGKSYLASYTAMKALSAGSVSTVVVTRAMTTVGKAIGHLPGTEIDKLLPYVAPIIEYFGEFIGREEVQKLIKAGIIRIIPLALLRGYTFKDAFIILDEAQNTTPHEFKTIMTRIGENSRIAVLGDLDQSDIQNTTKISGLEDFIERLDVKEDDTQADSEFVGFVQLDKQDIMRSAVVREVLDIYSYDYDASIFDD